jgi:NADPH:quinone reductase-like Zn-dependent oxidoreductase
MHGKPRAIRIMPRLMKMPIGRPGVDVAGEVVAVGSKVTQFKPGDAVFGACRGSVAEYACAREAGIALKPPGVTFEQAASVNVAGLTALQSLRKANIQSGSSVLINGAAGGVGTFAVQIARTFGAHVTGVCSTRNLELVQSIGADEVIDYTWHDFTKNDERYDLILDCVGNHPFSECRRVLNPRGKLVAIGMPHDASMMAQLPHLAEAVVLSLFGSQKLVWFLGKASQADLKLYGEFITGGKVKPVIEKIYPLSEAAGAIRHVEEGHARGKVLVTLQ